MPVRHSLLKRLHLPARLSKPIRAAGAAACQKKNFACPFPLTGRGCALCFTEVCREADEKSPVVACLSAFGSVDTRRKRDGRCAVHDDEYRACCSRSLGRKVLLLGPAGLSVRRLVYGGGDGTPVAVLTGGAQGVAFGCSVRRTSLQR